MLNSYRYPFQPAQALLVGSLAQLAHRLAACEAVLDVVGTGGGGVGRVFRSVIAAQLAAVSRTLHIGERPAVIAHDGHLRRPLQRRQGLGNYPQHCPALVPAVVAGSLRGSRPP